MKEYNTLQVQPDHFYHLHNPATFPEGGLFSLTPSLVTALGVFSSLDFWQDQQEILALICKQM